MKLNSVELFCGYGSITEELKHVGFSTFKTDIRRRKGVCEPDLKINIMELNGAADIPFNKVHILWASPPCDVWSYASGSFHWNPDGSPKTKKCLEHIEILKKTLAVIEEVAPDIWFIENPRGRLRHYRPFLDWLVRMEGKVKILTYSSYGFPTAKPTNIFTNTDIEFKELGRFGRGAKSNFKLDNISKGQKQKVPGALAKDVAEYVRAFFQNKPRGSF